VAALPGFAAELERLEKAPKVGTLVQLRLGQVQAVDKRAARTVHILKKDVPPKMDDDDYEALALEVVALNTLEGHLSWYDMSLSEFYHPSYVRREQLLADEHAAEEP
jgi:hypothetical protein